MATFAEMPPDAEALPGEAASWAPGEPPVGSADEFSSANAPKPPGFDGTTPDTRKLAELKRTEIAANAPLYGDISERLERDRKRAEDAIKNAGVEAGNLKPWNAEEESRKRQTDPIAAFGSFGSVFGILASAFTGQPMETAMNASAAAMNAIKEGDAKEYDRAYKAWQDNNKLALDRHKIQHDAYTDAVSLLNTNMAAGQAQLRVQAARFGDQKALFLLDRGLDKEVLDLMTSRQKLATDLATAQPKIWLENAKMSDLMNSGYDPKNPTTPESMKAIEGWKARWAPAVRTQNTPAKALLDKFLVENPEATADEVATFLRNSKGPSDAKLGVDQGRINAQLTRNDEIARHNKALEEISRGRGDVAALRAAEIARHNKALEGIGQARVDTSISPEEAFTAKWFEENPEGTTDQFTAALAAFRKADRPPSAGATTLTSERQIAAAMARKKADLLEAGKDEETATRESVAYGAELKRTMAVPSGNRMDDLSGKIDRITYMEDTIGKVEALLKKHKAITGLGGKITRPAEIIGNVFGSNDTDRKQFERYISELKEWAPRALTDSNGRPLAAEAGNVSNIVAGLQIGDTAANTARAYLELRQLLAKMKSNLATRRDGPGAETRTTPAPNGGTTPPPSEPLWKRAPVVQ